MHLKMNMNISIWCDKFHSLTFGRSFGSQVPFTSFLEKITQETLKRP